MISSKPRYRKREDRCVTQRPGSAEARSDSGTRLLKFRSGPVRRAAEQRPGVFEFGPYRLDGASRRLLRDGEELKLPPKAFDVLLALLMSRGRAMPKQELMEKVWPDTFVEEANLAVNVSLLRGLLGERSDGGQYIETLPRRGYRFAAVVREVGDRDDESGSQHESSPFEINQGVAFNPHFYSDSAVGVSQSINPVIVPETRYAKSGDVNIAYQVVGDGPIDLVFVMGWISHLEYFWKEPSFASFLLRLASFSRLILFDKRGTGLSDSVPLSELPTLEQRMDDVRAVMDAVGSKRAALIGVSEGGPMCALFAATYPEKTSALVMIGTYAKRISDPDYPWAPTAEDRERFYEEIRTKWGGPVGLEERAPGMANDPRFRNWWATYLRMGASPGAALTLTEMNAQIDVRKVLPSVRVPSLVIHRTRDRCLKVEEGRFVASLIPGARFVEMPGEDHLPFVGDQNGLLDEVQEFLTGEGRQVGRERVLATVMVAGVNQLEGITSSDDPDRAGFARRLLGYVSTEMQLLRGREIDVSGNGFMAAFDGPARAIRCARAISDTARRLGLDVRVGLHTGECDLIDGRVGGIAVDIAKEIASQASRNEILVSRTVKDLVAGSGLVFNDCGLHSVGESLGEWQLFSVAR
jgi:pimeloyl-ACP methyl ester carboxylesterase/DNA-binding winged helix-turn-helix (wHTH) protein